MKEPSPRTTTPFALAEPAAPRKEYVSMFEQLFAHFAPWSPAINHCLCISTQMRPTQLTLSRRITVVGFGPITANRPSVVLS